MAFNLIPHQHKVEVDQQEPLQILELRSESIHEVAIRLSDGPQHQHINDVALLQMSIDFFSELHRFLNDYEQMPQAKIGFRSSPQDKIDIGNCLLAARDLSVFGTTYVFTVGEHSQENSLKKKIAIDCSQVSEGFLRAVNGVTDDSNLTKDKAGFLGEMINETSMAMRALITQLSMMIVGTDEKNKPARVKVDPPKVQKTQLN